MTQIVLLERVERLGQMGDVVTVRPGYARNFLIPQKKALRATAENLQEFEKRRKQFEADNLKRKQEAEAIKTKMEGLAVKLIRQASDGGQLYGSVTSADIAHAVTEAGFTVNGAQVKLRERIKTLGSFSTQVSLHPEVTTDVTVHIAQSEDAMPVTPASDQEANA